jgi:hypothetical protein
LKIFRALIFGQCRKIGFLRKEPFFRSLLSLSPDLCIDTARAVRAAAANSGQFFALPEKPCIQA